MMSLAASMPGTVATVAKAVWETAARLGQVRLVCVDGPAGSGKTTFADQLAARLGSGRATVVHLDDLYDGWSGLEGSLWTRVSEQVLEPLRAGRAGRFQRYDWETGRFDGWVDVPVAPVLVLEGCGSGRVEGAGLRSLLVWVEVPRDLRLQRGLERDGEHLRDQWTAWMDEEQRHFAANDTRARADVWLDGSGTMHR
ncbi:MAG: uridine kinase [Micrococcales bacterium]|nr:uridine kinase [Micrococcales bacterium]MCL2669001.1 uridine kinase [Micrococcales bacterium]